MAKTHYVRYSAGTSKSYGVFHFLWDLFLIVITGGLWLLWIILRYLRTH